MFNNTIVFLEITDFHILFSLYVYPQRFPLANPKMYHYGKIDILSM